MIALLLSWATGDFAILTSAKAARAAHAPGKKPNVPRQARDMLGDRQFIAAHLGRDEAGMAGK